MQFKACKKHLAHRMPVCPTPLPLLLPLLLPADYLPCPLDIKNVALDLDKGEARVLLPCSK